MLREINIHFKDGATEKELNEITEIIENRKFKVLSIKMKQEYESTKKLVRIIADESSNIMMSLYRIMKIKYGNDCTMIEVKHK